MLLLLYSRGTVRCTAARVGIEATILRIPTSRLRAVQRCAVPREVRLRLEGRVAAQEPALGWQSAVMDGAVPMEDEEEQEQEPRKMRLAAQREEDDDEEERRENAEEDDDVDPGVFEEVRPAPRQPPRPPPPHALPHHTHTAAKAL